MKPGIYQFKSDESVYRLTYEKVMGRIGWYAQCILSLTKPSQKFEVNLEHWKRYQRMNLITELTEEEYENLRVKRQKSSDHLRPAPEQVELVQDLQGQEWEALFG